MQDHVVLSEWPAPQDIPGTARNRGVRRPVADWLRVGSGPAAGTLAPQAVACPQPMRRYVDVAPADDLPAEGPHRNDAILKLALPRKESGGSMLNWPYQAQRETGGKGG